MNPVDVLIKYWWYTQFRLKQEEIINEVIAKKDVLALLPTGGGKSICYQVPALMQEGICIVISPLIALMHDQILFLQSKGIKEFGLANNYSLLSKQYKNKYIYDDGFKTWIYKKYFI